MNTQRKWLFLVGLVIVWILVLIFQFSEDEEEIDSPVIVQNTSVTPNHKPPSSVTRVVLTEDFDNPRQHVKLSTPRNIFNPLGFTESKRKASVKKPSSTPKTPTRPRTSPTVTQKPPAPPPGPSPGELAAQRARQQLNQYRFLGYLTKGGQSQAFLSNGQAIYIVKQGEQVEGRIRVRKIDPTIVVLSVTVLETGTDVEATIPLTKEQQG